MIPVIQTYLVYAVILGFTSEFILLLSTHSCLGVMRLKPAYLLNLAKFGLILSGLMPLVVKWSSAKSFLISSGGSFVPSETLVTLKPNYLAAMQMPPYGPKFEVDWITIVFFVLILGCLFELWVYLKNGRTIHSCISSATPLRQFKRLRVMVSDKIRVPFAFHNFRSAYVLIPEDFCHDSELLTLSIRHEIQHHRQRDTLWVHVLQGLRVLFFWHPGVRFLVYRLSEVQELACDEALLGQANVSTHAYSRCLLKAAQSAVGNHRKLIGTVGMTTSSSSKTLTRRIEMMFRVKVKSPSRVFMGMATMFLISVITTLSFATGSLVQYPKLSLQDVQSVIDNLPPQVFPIEVNKEILDELNNYIGSQAGQDFLRASLERKELYSEIFAEHLLSRVPLELEAVALVESGFENLPQNINYPYSAGMWQFIPQTARNYGLRVDDTMDDRFDITQATGAASRLLAALYLRFEDWRLAILAYNAGETRVQEGIEKMKSRDPWKIIEGGYYGDDKYLAKVMAGVLILKNPQWISQN